MNKMAECILIQTQQSQNIILSQKMNLNLSVLQMQRTALSLFVLDIQKNNPLADVQNVYTPWTENTQNDSIFEDILRQEKSLFEELREELAMDICEDDYYTLYMIIGNLDSSGFLSRDILKLCPDNGERIRSLVMSGSIWSVELIKDRLCKLVQERDGQTCSVNSAIIDFYLWPYAKQHHKEMAHIPIHHTRCVYY